MKLNLSIGLFLVVLLDSTSLFASEHSSYVEPAPKFIANLPPGEEVEAPPEPVVESSAIYLDVDSKGNVYSDSLVRNDLGVYEFSHKLVSKETLSNLRSRHEVVLQNMENITLPGEVAATSSGSTCTLPSFFSIVSNGDTIPLGNIKVLNTNRPPDTDTQWLVYDFYTIGYRNAGAHMPNVMFHEDVLHGWGAFIGDNHGSPYGCGASSRFNSQIEGWVQYAPAPPPGTTTSTWQSYTFASSCGNEMYDGPAIIAPGFYAPKYRMEIQASTGHWVQYRILQYKNVFGSGWGWHVLTNYTVLDVDTGNWAHPYVFNNSAQGIYMGSTKSAAVPWSIYISGVQCGWF